MYIIKRLVEQHTTHNSFYNKDYINIQNIFHTYVKLGPFPFVQKIAETILSHSVLRSP